MGLVTLSLCALLFGVQSLCQPCDWGQGEYLRRSSVLLDLLEQMGGEFTQYRGPVRFPYELHRMVEKAPMEDRIAFLSEAIRNINDLFHRDLHAVTWNQTMLKKFRSVLLTMLNQLKTCAQPSPEYEKRLRKYFEKLHNKVLNKMNYNLQSWEFIRKAVREHLQWLDMLWVSIVYGKTK